jgi:F0F1-type ATP synthase assembly protein I
MNKRANADSTSSGGDEGWAVLTTLIGGFVVWGGIGWALDRWWGTTFATPVGLIIGMVLGIFAVVARHGGVKAGQPSTADLSSRCPRQYDPGLYRSNRSTSDPAPRPLPANTRRETECP